MNEVSVEQALAMSQKALAQSMQLVQVLNSRADEAVKGQAEASRNARWAVTGIVAVVLVSGVGVALGLSYLPLEGYIYTDNAKNICEAQVQGAPLLSVATVTDFAKECMLDMDTMSHDSLERDLTRMADRCFTPGFRKQFFQASWLGDRMGTVKEQFLRVSAQTMGPPLVENEGPSAQGYQWTVQVPIRRTFKQGESIKGTSDRIYRVQVYRVTRNAYNPVGLGINSVDERTGR